jgi:uncharacterized membrane protein
MSASLANFFAFVATLVVLICAAMALMVRRTKPKAWQIIVISIFLVVLVWASKGALDGTGFASSLLDAYTFFLKLGPSLVRAL